MIQAAWAPVRAATRSAMRRRAPSAESASRSPARTGARGGGPPARGEGGGGRGGVGLEQAGPGVGERGRPPAALLGLLVEPRVVDGDAGGAGGGADDALVSRARVAAP